MPDEFSGKVAVITGGSRGIGREIAVEFARAGAQTVIVSSSAEHLAAASKIITAAGGPAPVAVAADLRQLDGCKRVFDAVKDKSTAATFWCAQRARPAPEISSTCRTTPGSTAMR